MPSSPRMRGIAVVAVGLGLARPLHQLQAVLLASLLPLFLGALISDVTYTRSFHVQWANFSSWLIAGGLFVGGFTVLWAVVDVLRGGAARRKRHAIHLMVLVAMWTLGFVSALVHAKDAWATMPEGLYLTAITSLLALIAVWMGFSRMTDGEVA
jgi:uncharacterized membrane protein